MNIPVIRESNSKTSKQLRRARKLYGRLIYREVMRNPEIVFICAQRVIARGLYSPKAGLKDVTFSLIRKIYLCHRSDTGRDIDWHQWLRENETADWFAMGHYKRIKYSKPVLRLVA